MSEARELILASIAPVELPSGLKVKLRKPRAADCIIEGGIPLPIMASIEAKTTATEDEDEAARMLSPEEMEATQNYNRALVRLSVLEIEGTAVKLVDDDLDVLDGEDFQFILFYARRERDAEGKA